MRRKIVYLLFLMLIISSISVFIIPVKGADNTFYHITGVYGSGSPYHMDGAIGLHGYGDYLFVSSVVGERLVIFDISTKSSPSLVTTLDMGGGTRDIDISTDGKWAFVTTQYGWTGNNYGNFSIVNLSDINYPTIESTTTIDNTDGCVIGIDFVDSINTAFVLSYSTGKLYSYDCSDKTNPSLLDSLSVGSNPHEVWANSTVAFVCGFGDLKVHTIDVSDTSNIFTLDDYYSTTLRRAAHVYGNAPYMYVANLGSSGYDGAVHIFDISTPSNIVETSIINYGSSYAGCSAMPNGNSTRLFTVKAANSNNDGTVYGYDITNKANPSLLDSISHGDTTLDHAVANGIWVTSNYVYVTDYDSDGISVLRFGDEIPIPTPDTFRFTDISGQSNNTNLPDQYLWVNGTREGDVQYIQLQISNTTDFSSPFVNLEDICESNYAADFWENSTHYRFNLSSGLDSYGGGAGVHYYRYRIKKRVVTS